MTMVQEQPMSLEQKVEAEELQQSIKKTGLSVVLKQGASERSLNVAAKLLGAFVKLIEEVTTESQGEGKEMMDAELKKNVQEYINCFRNEIGQYLQKNIGQKFNVVSFSSGVILEIEQIPNIANVDSFKQADSIKEAFNILGRTPEEYLANENTIARYKKALDENKIDTVGGKILVGNTIPSILIIANNSDKLWTPENAKEDVETIVSFISGDKKELEPKPNK